MGDVSKEMETQRKNQKKEMLEIKNIVTKEFYTKINFLMLIVLLLYEQMSFP